MARAQSTLAQVSISIRAKAWQRDLIDQAAARQSRSRSEFMLDASCREAEEVLLNQTFVTVGAPALKNSAGGASRCFVLCSDRVVIGITACRLALSLTKLRRNL